MGNTSSRLVLQKVLAVGTTFTSCTGTCNCMLDVHVHAISPRVQFDVNKKLLPT